jgi:Flp pilus assembly protein TadG
MKRFIYRLLYTGGFMRARKSSERGQVLVLIALGIIGLVGITGLAIDGSIILADRRHAQNAADTASLAGALDRIQTLGAGMDDADSRASMRITAWDLAEENGYVHPSANSTVEVYLCDETAMGADCPAPYTGDDDYVQVIITSHVDTFFARVLGVPQLTNRVQAVALADDDDSGPLFDGNSIIALSPDCINPGTLVLQGTGDITLNGGGLYVNSDDTCGFNCDSNSVSLDIIDGDITTAGSDFSSVSASCDANIDETPNFDGDQFSYPEDLPVIPEPTEWCDKDLHPGSYTNDDVNSVTYLWPGAYDNFPPKKEQPLGALYDNIIMKSGIYCVGETIKLSSRNLILESEGRLDPDAGGVTIYIRSGYGFQLEGGEFHLKAQPTGTYANYLFIVEPPPFDTYPDGWGTPESCKINGNTNDEFQGGVYAPYCDVAIDGSAGSVGLDAQVIGWTVKITGGAGLNFTYDSDNNPTDIKPPQIGISK